MKKILFVSFFSPPMGSGGSQRILKILNNLKGFEKYLLTANYPSIRYKDEFLKVSEDVKIFRVYYKDPRLLFPKALLKLIKRKKREEGIRNVIEEFKVLKGGLLSKLKLSLFIPDEKITWVKDATREGKRIIKENEIDAVITTGPPHSVHLIGLKLKTMGVKWVMDLRDLWSDNPFVLYPEKVREKNRRMEENCIREADLILTVTKSFKERLLKTYNFLSEERVKVVYGGYDENDFNVPHKKLKGFTISYAGSFYSIQTPVYFLKAVREIIDEDEEIKRDIKVYILGPFEENTKRIVSFLGLKNYVVVTGFIPHKEAISYMLGSSVLFLYLARKGFETVPQKTFEYMRAGRRILALIPDGECKEILETCGFKDNVDPENVSEIKKKIKELFGLWKRGEEFKPDIDCVKRYSMDNLVDVFINSLKEGGVI
ncbi:MAG: glycosyltransferase [Caldisericia bacterium]|nr:glycosyltransferase [Caldisericia bacterium]